MIKCDLFSSIPDWIIEHPRTATVFEQLGFDASCGGKSLEYLCLQQNLNPNSVLRRLHRAIWNHEGPKAESNHEVR